LDPDREDAVGDVIADPQAEKQAQTLNLSSTVINYPSIHSRVLSDLWHLMDQFKIPVCHGLQRPFACALQDAIFLVDQEDKAVVQNVLASRGTPFDQMVLWNSDWVWQRVKCYVPPPEILVGHVTSTLQKFGPLKDALTGQPLFNDLSWDKAHNVIENIHMGLYSDPPGIKFYTAQRTDSNGLTMYKCCRGTNHVKGGVHQNIIKCFGSYNASPCFAVNLLRDYCLTHNLKVCIHI
jgi:hypothetical protein